MKWQQHGWCWSSRASLKNCDVVGHELMASHGGHPSFQEIFRTIKYRSRYVEVEETNEQSFVFVSPNWHFELVCRELKIPIRYLFGNAI